MNERSEVSRLERLVIRMKQALCRHKFYTEQISPKDYTPPDRPDGISICDEYRHPSFTKRVCWPCGKCGKRFYAHCGLDIVGTHGKWAAYHAPKLEKFNALAQSFLSGKLA